MPVRKIIEIDEEKCDGCGLCIPSCPEGALQIIDGKARLVSESYCDGMGACIGDCPRDAIKMIEKEAPEFDEEAVKRKMLNSISLAAKASEYPACPGSMVRNFASQQMPTESTNQPVMSRLSNWPVQLMLVPPSAPYLRDADLLICADCVPFALADFHSRFLAGRRLLVGCPKLDDLNYYHEKLKSIFNVARPKSLLILKMEVPCCNGIAEAAIAASRTIIPQIKPEIVTIGIGGEIKAADRLPGKIPHNK